MNKEAMESLRQKINVMIISEEISKDDLLQLSRELDSMIIDYLKGQDVAAK